MAVQVPPPLMKVLPDLPLQLQLPPAPGEGDGRRQHDGDGVGAVGVGRDLRVRGGDGVEVDVVVIVVVIVLVVVDVADNVADGAQDGHDGPEEHHLRQRKTELDKSSDLRLHYPSRVGKMICTQPTYVYLFHPALYR